MIRISLINLHLLYFIPIVKPKKIVTLTLSLRFSHCLFLLHRCSTSMDRLPAGKKKNKNKQRNTKVERNTHLFLSYVFYGLLDDMYPYKPLIYWNNKFLSTLNISELLELLISSSLLELFIPSIEVLLVIVLSFDDLQINFFQYIILLELSYKCKMAEVLAFCLHLLVFLLYLFLFIFIFVFLLTNL